MKTEEALFDDLAEIYDHWISVAMESTSNSEAGLKWADDPEAFKKLGEVLHDTNTISHQRPFHSRSEWGGPTACAC